MNTVHVPRDVIDAREPKIRVKGTRQSIRKEGLCESGKGQGCETSIVARPLKDQSTRTSTINQAGPLTSLLLCL